jgi:predicted nucleotidyltransferase
VNDWPSRRAAEQLRQWPVLEELIGRLEADGAFEAAILLGSLARGESDAMSDVDLLVVVRDGLFEDAWSRRETFSTGALYRWDETEPGREVAKHAWLSAGFVLVELPMTTRAGGNALADPFVVIWGDPAVAEELPRIPPITRAELQEYVDAKLAAGTQDPVQSAWDELAAAVRGWRRG